MQAATDTANHEMLAPGNLNQLREKNKFAADIKSQNIIILLATGAT